MMKPGDTVRVHSPNPIAVGRGIGIVTRTGHTVVSVKFPQWERPITCLAEDCTVIEPAQEPAAE